MHRWLAMGTVLVMLLFWLHAHLKNQTHAGIHLLAIMGIIQLTLGILSFLSGVNIVLATLHQAGALIILGLLTFCLYRAYEYKSLSDA